MLCCDGGGLRGSATINFLMELEEALGQPLANFFDLMAGTSTGAINVAMMAGKGNYQILNQFIPNCISHPC